jgi:hypothetical protein
MFFFFFELLLLLLPFYGLLDKFHHEFEMMRPLQLLGNSTVGAFGNDVIVAQP